MQEVIEEIIKKRDKSLKLYHNSMKHEDKMYHSGWVAGLEFAFNVIRKSGGK